MDNGCSDGEGSFKVKHGSDAVEVTDVHESGEGEVGIGYFNVALSSFSAPGVPSTRVNCILSCIKLFAHVFE